MRSETETILSSQNFVSHNNDMPIGAIVEQTSQALRVTNPISIAFMFLPTRLNLDPESLG